jgi:hypothetical protein
MADPTLEKSWRVTRTLLARARAALPLPSPATEGQIRDALEEYERMLYHNELELALDALEHAGELVAARGEFWRDLERAAKNMELVDRASKLRRRFQETREERHADNS